MTTLSCKVTSVEAITDTVYRVRLVPEAAFSFRAGQYLMVVMDERDKRPFSMASTPAEHIKIILLPYKNVPATSWPVFKWMLC